MVQHGLSPSIDHLGKIVKRFIVGRHLPRQMILDSILDLVIGADRFKVADGLFEFLGAMPIKDKGTQLVEGGFLVLGLALMDSTFGHQSRRNVDNANPVLIFVLILTTRSTSTKSIDTKILSRVRGDSHSILWFVAHVSISPTGLCSI
jgi:hypothetical protein